MRSLGAVVVIAVVLGLGSATSAAQAASQCWVGPRSGGQWTTAANWNGPAGHKVPGAGDEANTVGTGGIYNCTPADDIAISANATIGQTLTSYTQLDLAAGKTFTISGVNNGDFGGLGAMNVAAGATVRIPAGAYVPASGTVTLADTGALRVDGTFASQFALEQVRGGSTTVSSTGKLITPSGYEQYVIDTKLDMQGLLDLRGSDHGGQIYFTARAGSPVSKGSWLGSPDALIVSNGAAPYEIDGPITGSLSVQYATTGSISNAMLRFGGTAACTLSDLKIFAPGNLDLRRDCSASGTFSTIADDFYGRSGPGTLTAAKAVLGGGVLSGGLTRITGATTISGNPSIGPLIRGGATLRTEGATTWQAGAVTLGATNENGTWQNAGTLTIDNTKGDVDLRDAGGTSVLSNLAGGSIVRQAPTGNVRIGGHIANAGSVNVADGSLGAPDSTGSYTQSGGTTRVASGATLDLPVRLTGGTLKGNGTVRSVANDGGTVAPGESPGALTISGPFTQGAGGTLEEDVAGTAQSSFDRLLVGGAATLGGKLKIVRAPAFAPALKDTFGFLTAASRTGSFAALTGDTTAPGGLTFAVGYQAKGATLCFVGGTAPCAASQPPPPTTTPTSTTPPPTTTTPPPTTPSTTTTPPPATTPPAATTPAPVSTPAPAATAPATTPTPTPTPTPAKPAASTVSIASIATLPSARKCVSRRDFRIRLRIPKGKRIVRAEVRVAGKRVKVLEGKRLTSRVRLTGLPKGTFKVKITLLTADGGSIAGTRTYHTCVRKRT